MKWFFPAWHADHEMSLALPPCMMPARKSFINGIGCVMLLIVGFNPVRQHRLPKNCGHKKHLILQVRTKRFYLWLNVCGTLLIKMGDVSLYIPLTYPTPCAIF